jgi:hypothetical protein
MRKEHQMSQSPSTVAAPLQPYEDAAALPATTAAVVAADGARVREALESVGWERSGLLRRLRRS